MHEPSDGIAEEVERQLQLALAGAAVAARRAIAARQHAIEQAGRDTHQAARQVKAQIDAERALATARLQPVFDPGWWETAGPQDVADMWQGANSWRDLDRPAAGLTIFDHAAGRIRQEVRDRSGLDPTQLIALGRPAGQSADVDATKPNLDARRGFDDPQRRDQLRTQLAAAGVPEPAIEARTLADLGQAREPAEAAQTPLAAGSGARPAAARSARRELHRQR